MNTAPITADMSIAELFTRHPGAEHAFLEIAPAFSHLADPVLRENIARATTLQRAAKAAGLEPEVLIARLRQELGQAIDSPMLRRLPQAPTACTCTGSCATTTAATLNESTPAWAEAVTNPDHFIDADEILARGESPLDLVAAGSHGLKPGEVLAVRVAFRPTPLIQRFRAEGYRTHCRTLETGRFELLITTGNDAPPLIPTS